MGTLGFINIFYGNDADFGVFMILISFLFYAPFGQFLKNKLNISISVWIKIVLTIFLIWTNLAVGAVAERYLF